MYPIASAERHLVSYQGGHDRSRHGRFRVRTVRSDWCDEGIGIKALISDERFMGRNMRTGSKLNFL